MAPPAEHEPRPHLGGQAVIEGVMMRNGERVVVAVRRPKSGEIVIQEIRPFQAWRKLSQIPFLRGVYNLFEILVLGIKALNLSANLALEGEAEKFGPLELAISLILALGIAIGGFFILPLWLTNLFASRSSGMLFAFLEGLIRIAIFLIYLWGITLLRDIRRVLEYHGAEHKSIHTFEHGVELTVENAKHYGTRHARCGTSFLLLVAVIAILVFSLVGNPPLPWKVLSRILLLPVIAGFSYEALLFSGRHANSRWLRPLIAPGLWLQRLTTREPDESQLEVALAAVKAVL
ncbi:MAG: DUF1385 domain-containing protein [Candidatus Bipolaricaulia bacterium]